MFNFYNLNFQGAYWVCLDRAYLDKLNLDDLYEPILTLGIFRWNFFACFSAELFLYLFFTLYNLAY